VKQFSPSSSFNRQHLSTYFPSLLLVEDSLQTFCPQYERLRFKTATNNRQNCAQCFYTLESIKRRSQTGSSAASDLGSEKGYLEV
jgi:hypothetical protein